MKALSAMKSCEYMMSIAKFQYIAYISYMRKKYSRILGVISKKALTYSLVLIDILVQTENRQIPEDKKKMSTPLLCSGYLECSLYYMGCFLAPGPHYHYKIHQTLKWPQYQI